MAGKDGGGKKQDSVDGGKLTAAQKEGLKKLLKGGK